MAGCYIRPLEDNICYRAFTGCTNLFFKVVQRVDPHVHGSSIFVRKLLHDAVGGFIEALMIGEDRDYAKRVSRLGRFGFLQSVRIPVSMRRFEHDG